MLYVFTTSASCHAGMLQDVSELSVIECSLKLIIQFLKGFYRLSKSPFQLSYLYSR